ncbi:ABC transporter permease [Thermobispora bispora]
MANITYRAMLGRKRVWPLVLLPVFLLLMAGALRLLNGQDEQLAVNMLRSFAIGTVVPLIALIVGTGVIAPEIEDGTIVHLLAKPIPRAVIAFTKFTVAATLVVAFAVVPTVAAAWVLIGMESGVTAGYALGALAAGVVYTAVFLALGIVTRHAITIGVGYVLIWENLIAPRVPGARRVSVQQWAHTIADQISSSVFVKSDVALGLALPAVVIVTAGALLWAARRLRAFSLTGDA